MKKIFLFLFLGVMTSFGLHAQTGSVSGKVKNADSGQLMELVEVQVLGVSKIVFTNENGVFEIKEIPQGKHLVEINKDGFESLSVEVSVSEGRNTSLGTLSMKVNKFLESVEVVDITSIAELEPDVEDDNLSASGILHSSKDPFKAASAYTFSSARFRQRGYGSEETGLFFNGIPMNNVENGRAYWYLWGGLNDVTRDQLITEGLNPIDNGFGGFGGNVNINAKASDYRAGTKLVYSAANRSYRNRVMVTHSTGLLENGWALTVSGSKRWAEEGFIEGTSYDAYGYFMSVLKKFNEKHSVGLTVFGAPNERGGLSASIQPAYDLTGSNYYNPNWGWQDGKKRNARMSKSHQPVSILKHYWDVNSKLDVTTSVAYIFGDYGRTALNWVNAPDPRPDYYRNFNTFPKQANNQQLADDFVANSQLNWDKMYQTNGSNPDFIDADGVNQGKNASYFVEDRRRDVEQIVADINAKYDVSEELKLVVGANYNSYTAHNYTLVDDLLGADFVENVDKFADRTDPEFPLTDAEMVVRRQNDLDYFNENGHAEYLKEGDVYGHNYYAHINKTSGFANVDFTKGKFNVFGSVSLSQTTMWRDSKVKKGLFPENSKGESKKYNYFNYGAKAGVQYKYNGRNFFSLNAGYMTKAPSYRNLFLSPRTRNTALDYIGQNVSEKIMTADLGYEYRSIGFKFKANAYYTKFKDQTRSLSFYHDEERAFVNSVQSGIDKTHMGIEIGFDYKILDELSLIGAIAVGDHKYDSRPLLTMVADNNNEFIAQNQEVLVTNFKETGYPQQAYTVGLKYSSSKYWWAGINANFYREMYLSYNPLRRLSGVWETYENDPQLLKKITQQTKLDDQFTLDMSIGKSWRIDYKYYININLSVNNVLNNTDFVTGGYEQSRLKNDFSISDIAQFPPKLYYAYGRNFFLNMSFRF